MIYSKFGYEPRAFVNADARLEKWLKDKKKKESTKKTANLYNRSIDFTEVRDIETRPRRTSKRINTWNISRNWTDDYTLCDI
ncbi:hypothetical protein DCM90_01350 [Levilactobacillus bambusae]|uniref:Uncharacterized protein n=1 Tax=Levilactobacillus bambusae TaxID=2024736 RepID=A0A2V1N197_9LACO|nr:hypothetical protein DCM90_01350 [Levilactobacillus bambusae]